jgi:hypothetical protein
LPDLYIYQDSGWLSGREAIMANLTRRTLLGAIAAGAALSRDLPAGAQDLQPPPLPVPGGLPPPLPPSAGAREPAPANTILQPGMRLVWFGGAASIPGERNQLVPDPNGGWKNRVTGQRYNEFDIPGPAGVGFGVMDVLAAGPDGFLLGFSQLLMHTDAGNATTFIDTNGMVTGPSNIGDYWVSPARLATLTDTDDGRSRIMRMPYVLDGRGYRVVRLQSQNGDGWNQTTYDLDSGLQLVFSSSAEGAPVLIRSPANLLAQGAGSTMLTYGQFVGARHTNLPGPGSRFPDAIGQVRAFVYTGTRGIFMSGSDLQVPPGPIEIRYDVTNSSQSYLAARMSTTGVVGAPPSPVERIIPAGTFGSLWMNPNTLVGYRQGELLDQDPITGVQVAVVGRRNNLVTIAAKTGLAQYTCGYDPRSGLLRFADLRTQVGPATDILSVQLASTQ